MIPSSLTIGLWSQQGGFGDLVWGVLLFLFIIFQAIRAVREANLQKQQETEAEAERLREAEAAANRLPRNRERKKKTRSSPLSFETEFLEAERRESSPRTVLAKELAPQGEGRRFEADPGTMDASRLVAPSIEPGVKPTLESMTGIYEAAPTTTELQDQSLTLLDIQKLMARPEGIRQAVLLAEILKRPEY